MTGSALMRLVAHSKRQQTPQCTIVEEWRNGVVGGLSVGSDSINSAGTQSSKGSVDSRKSALFQRCREMKQLIWRLTREQASPPPESLDRKSSLNPTTRCAARRRGSCVSFTETPTYYEDTSEHDVDIDVASK